MAVKLTDRVQWLNYHHLHYFYVIAKEGGIARAAEKLNLGQPTLSAQLRLLEESLGQSLFEREKQRLRLTEAGKIALEYAEEVFSLGAEMIDAIQDRRQNHRIHVQIGAMDSVPKHLVLDVFMAANKIGPCSVSILEGKGDELMRALAAHELDLVIANYAPSLGSQRLHSRKVGRQDVMIFGATKFKGLKSGFPESLRNQPFIMPTFHSRLRMDLDHFFKVHAIQPDIVAETQDTSIQKLLGVNGFGLVPVPAIGAEELVREKKMLSLGKLANVHEEYWLVAGDRKIENPIAAKLMRSYVI
jgi:LysR family transcriptional regulator, transcriptional activator of nhaA